MTLREKHKYVIQRDAVLRTVCKIMICPIVSLNISKLLFTICVLTPHFI